MIFLRTFRNIWQNWGFLCSKRNFVSQYICQSAISIVSSNQKASKFIAKELCHHAVYFLKSSCCALEARIQFAAVKKLDLFAYMYAYLYIYINLFIYLFWCLFSFKYKYNFTTHSPHIRTAYCIVYTQCKGCPITTKHNCE